MRITNKVLVNDFLGNLHSNLENMQKLQEQLSTGHEVNRPSDDPFKVARTMELTSGISANERYKSNIDEATGWLDTTDTALGQMGDALQRVRELVLQGSTGTNNNDDKIKIKDEIEQIKGQLVQIANTAYDGRYIFGGDKTTQPPFKQNADGSVVYQGSTNGLVREFSQGVKLDIATTGNKFLSLFSNSVAGSTENNYITKTGSGGDVSVEGISNFPSDSNIKYALKVTGVDSSNPKQVTGVSLEMSVDGKTPETITTTPTIIHHGSPENYTEVKFDNMATGTLTNGGSISFNIKDDNSNNTGTSYAFTQNSNVMDKIINKLSNGESISDDLSKLDDQIDNLLELRSKEGAISNRMKDMGDKNDTETYNMTTLLSKTYDIDVAEKVMQYKVMEAVYTSSLQTGAKILQPSLLDFLR